MRENTSIIKTFSKYVSQNILGMLGVSAYVLVDTYFISQVAGSDGIAALNLVLPLYSLIYSFGALFGVGSATRFNIFKAREDSRFISLFTNSILWGLIVSIPFILAGVFCPDLVVRIMGGDSSIIAIGSGYTQLFLVCAPFFILDLIFAAFVRNDGRPDIAMFATIASSLFNILMDYVFMFPLNMGMEGAALATGIAPLVGMLICSIHIFSKKSNIHLVAMAPSFKILVYCSKLGVSAFVAEISTAITTLVFNFLILSISGNIGIAAYGVICNTAIVATALYTGIANGSQPIVSDFYGRGDHKSTNTVLKYAIGLSLIISSLIILLTNVFAQPLVDVFNTEQNTQMADLATVGVKLYFIGYLFAGINIIGTAYLSATESASMAFAASISRGFIAIIACAFILGNTFGMTGIWLAFAASEIITCFITITGLLKKKR